MATKKKKKKRPADTRITLRQHIKQVHEAYDHLEQIALSTAERALREAFGFGDVRLKRFREKYLWYFGEEAAKYAEAERAKMLRRRRK